MVLEGEEDESVEDALVVAVVEILDNSFEGNDESEGLEKKPCISKRLRTFHIV